MQKNARVLAAFGRREISLAVASRAPARFAGRGAAGWSGRMGNGLRRCRGSWLLRLFAFGSLRASAWPGKATFAEWPCGPFRGCHELTIPWGLPLSQDMRAHNSAATNPGPRLIFGMRPIRSAVPCLWSGGVPAHCRGRVDGDMMGHFSAFLPARAGKRGEGPVAQRGFSSI